MSKPKHFSGECPKVVSGSNKIVRNTARTEPSEAFEESNFLPSPVLLESSALLWNGAWDSHGVYVYQAFNDTIADYAVEHQTFSGCPAWKPDRGTWIKPSFAWMLYRSGYGHKPNQNRILKIHLSHSVVAHILSCGKLANTNRDSKGVFKTSNPEGGGRGVIQWDPERDLYSSENKFPRRMLRQRAIQVCVSGNLSRFYSSNILSISEVTDLAHQIGEAHKFRNDKDVEEAVRRLMADMLRERPYFPYLVTDSKLKELGMLGGDAADAVKGLGLGKAC